jgi:hypothetical protein
MRDNQILHESQSQKLQSQQAARIEARLDRLERLLNEAIGAYLNARFPYGRATDRWARR